jgi:NAD(P)-dependent dehydrogenase (short-subunit alcohol dehydrogenase family)
MSPAEPRRTVVVTGGAAGIGAAIAREFGRQGVHVVTLDPQVSLDGSSPVTGTGPTTAERIVAEGGSAQASNASVTDRQAVEELFDQVIGEHGGLHAVVNVAGISRPTDFASGTGEDWAAVLNVHVGGYLNVLGAALPRMTAAGHGRILGVTSGSGWRPANAGAYGCAKRAVAALTWRVGAAAPAGVTVNALSPIAETRMVEAARERAAAAGSGERSKSGGVSLATAPPPESLGPVAAYMAGDAFDWASGQIVFSNGAEAAWVTPPRLLEICRSSDTASLARVVDTVLQDVFGPVERSQSTNGGANPRFADVFSRSTEPARSAAPQRWAVVTDDADWDDTFGDTLAARGITCVRVGPRGLAADFEGASAQFAGAGADGQPVDGVVVALSGAGAAPPEATGWERILAEHAGLPDLILRDAAWARAVADYAGQSQRPVRLVSVVDATTSAGATRAQAAAQHARSALASTERRVAASVVTVEALDSSSRRAGAELAAGMLCSPDGSALSGAELLVGRGWFGLCSHPSAATSISYGGPTLPDWFDAALRRTITGRAN